MMNHKKTRREYLRDGRAPVPKRKLTSRIMSSIRAKNTRPEITVRKALRSKGLIGYRLHWKKVPGRPDICFPLKKIAIFVNGCYWHRCPLCKPSSPKTHKRFWNNKFKRNVKRDKNKIAALKKIGWKVFVIWECETKKGMERKIGKIRKYHRNKA